MTRMEALVPIMLLFFLSCSCQGLQTKWPVYFESMGQVHSLGNQWELIIRVETPIKAIKAHLNVLIESLQALQDVKSGDEEYSNSRLDELRAAWAARNAVLLLRCQKVSEQVTNMMDLVTNAKKNGEKRRRRETEMSDFEARDDFEARGLLQSLFGVAYAADVERVASSVSVVEAKLDQEMRGMANKASAISASTEEKIKEQQGEIEKNAKMARIIDEKVARLESQPLVRSSLSDLIHERRIAYGHIELSVSRLEAEMAELKLILMAAANQRLSSTAISARKLNAALLAIDSNLPLNTTLLFQENIWPYYSLLKTSLLAFDEEELKLRLLVPLKTSNRQLELFRVHNLPIRSKDEYAVITDIDPRAEYVIANEPRTHYALMAEASFQNCQTYAVNNTQHFYCGLQPLTSLEQRTCLPQLLRGVREPQYCQSKIVAHSVRPFSRLFNGSFVYSALEQDIKVDFECSDRSFQLTLDGFGVLNELGHECSISNDKFKYDSSIAGRSDVRVALGVTQKRRPRLDQFFGYYNQNDLEQNDDEMIAFAINDDINGYNTAEDEYSSDEDDDEYGLYGDFLAKLKSVLPLNNNE